MGKNLPILIILIVFVSSNFFLYNYLNNGFFTDKQPETPKHEIKKIIFNLIALNEDAIRRQIEENEKRIRELSSLELKELDEAARLRVLAELEALERDKKSLLEAEQQSKMDILEAQEKARNTAKTISELQAINARLGVELENLKKEFNAYKTGLKDSELLNNERLVLGEKFKGALSNIAEEIEYTDFSNKYSVQEILELNSSISDLKDKISEFITAELLNQKNDLETTFNSAINKEKQAGNSRLDQLRASTDNEIDALQAEITKLTSENNLIKENLEEKELEITNLEEEISKLLNKEPEIQEVQTEIVKEVIKEIVTEVSKPTPDTPVKMNWQYIPGLWKQDGSSLAFSGTKVESISWSKEKLNKDSTISFNGNFPKNGEFAINLFGDGKFKSWKQGLNIRVKSIGDNKSILQFLKNDISDKGIKVIEKEIATDISGLYYMVVNNGNLDLYINNVEVVSKLPLDMPREGHLGFGNISTAGLEFDLKNISIFDIK